MGKSEFKFDICQNDISSPIPLHPSKFNNPSPSQIPLTNKCVYIFVKQLYVMWFLFIQNQFDNHILIWQATHQKTYFLLLFRLVSFSSICMFVDATCLLHSQNLRVSYFVSLSSLLWKLLTQRENEKEIPNRLWFGRE